MGAFGLLLRVVVRLFQFVGLLSAGDHVFFRSPVSQVEQAAAVAAEGHIGILKCDFFSADRAADGRAGHTRLLIPVSRIHEATLRHGADSELPASTMNRAPRAGLPLLARRILVQSRIQFRSRGGRLYITQDDFLVGQSLAVQLLVGIQILAKRGSIQGNSGKRAARAGIGQDFGSHLRIRFGARCSADRAAGNADIASKREFALQQRLLSTGFHYEHYDIGFRTADLKAETTALNADRRRSAPPGAVRIVANHESFAELSAEYKRRFLYSRN